jgi:hypothetical protein
MKNMYRIMMVSVIATSSLTLGSDAASQVRGNAAKSEGSITNMNSYRCKDVMRMTGEERLITLGILHGYFLGKKNATSFDRDLLSKVTDDFMDYCLDNPNVKALEAFAKVYK